MLVLSRQRDQTIMIGDRIAVTVVDIRGDKVRLGIEAPEEIPVHRREVYDAIERDRRELERREPYRRGPNYLHPKDLKEMYNIC
jgi:carbon storage regulator